jgi:hypothetical protein
MGRRQLRRLALSLVAVVGIMTATLLSRESDESPADPGPDTPVSVATPVESRPVQPLPADQEAELRATRELSVALTDFAVLATTLENHEALVDGRSGLDEAVAAVAAVGRRNDGSSSAVRRGVAVLAAHVGDRWLAVRPVALSEATAEEGVLLIQALGRETGVRAAELAALLGSMTGPGATGDLEVIAEQLARPWPADSEIGADTPV